MCVISLVRLTFVSLDLIYGYIACLKLLESGDKATELLNSVLLIAHFFYGFALFLLPTAVGFYCKYLEDSMVSIAYVCM